MSDEHFNCDFGILVKIAKSADIMFCFAVKFNVVVYSFRMTSSLNFCRLQDIPNRFVGSNI